TCCFSIATGSGNSQGGSGSYTPGK
ncbi:TPA: streptolysin S family bacteriocin, partial [Streptococcus pyogenes]|nr:streptolysin S family bacteriocin [Streptococcus pyogenes]